MFFINLFFYKMLYMNINEIDTKLIEILQKFDKLRRLL